MFLLLLENTSDKNRYDRDARQVDFIIMFFFLIYTFFLTKSATMLLRKIGEFFQEPEDKCMQKLSEQKPKERPQLGNC